jgi:hypothetical protein
LEILVTVSPESVLCCATAPAPAAVPISMTADKQTAVVLVMSFLMKVGFILLPPFLLLSLD